MIMKRLYILTASLLLTAAALQAGSPPPGGGKFGYLPEEIAGGGPLYSIRQIYARYPYYFQDYRFNRFIKSGQWWLQRSRFYDTGLKVHNWLPASLQVEHHPDYRRWYILAEFSALRSNRDYTGNRLQVDLTYRNVSLSFAGRAVLRDGRSDPMRIYHTLINVDLITAGGLEIEWGWGVGRYHDSIFPLSRSGSELRVNRYHIRVLPGKPLVLDFYYTRYKYLDSGFAVDNFGDGEGLVFRALRFRAGVIYPTGTKALDFGIGAEQFCWRNSTDGSLSGSWGLFLSLRRWY